MSQRGISVLMYHALVEKPQAGLSPLHLDVDRFEQQLVWLHQQGYAGTSATDLLRSIISSSSAKKTIALTFDDGYLSLLTLAAPLLQQYGFAATLFLTTGFVGKPDFSAAPAFARDVPATDRPLTWPEIRALKSLGWDIQAHSHTHPPHAALPLPALAAEMRQSHQAITEALDSAPTLYAFPYGSYDRHTLKSLKTNGYEAGFSVHNGQIGPTSDRRRLPRIEINSGCSLSNFAELVRTGYASPQEQLRARLRDALFYFPAVKDGLQRLSGRCIN